MQDQIQGFLLSPQQKQLWLLQQNSQVYRSQCAILLEGNLKIEVLKAALQQVVNRHEILRTTFHRTRGIKLPIQVITNDSDLSIQDIDLRTQPDGIETLWQQVSQKPIDWEKGSLLHVVLARLSSSEHVLLIGMPSLCADATTLENLRREISRSYAACLQGEELKNEPLQYADLSDWQNELLESEETEAGRDYWRKLDISSLETLKLPVTYQSQEKEEFLPQVLSLPISPELAEKIKAIARHSQTSVSAFFLTCWQILLWRLNETSDIVVGTAGDGRNYEELKDALGLLVKYLPLHSHLEADDKFREVLTQVEESLANAYTKQQYFSWEQIITPDENHQALFFFPFCFEFESRSDQYCAGDISFSLYKQYTCTDRFQVKLSCISQGDSLSAEFHYDVNLFRAEDIQGLAGQFETLLASVVENSQGAIAQFNILPPCDCQQLLVEFNNTQTAALPYSCIHHEFEKQAQLTPDRLAVVFENQQLTYRELNERANQLAHYLQQLGVKPEAIVGICVERSIEMVVGILSILKAGGAYLPLDPAYPQERLAWMLEDAQVPLLLTQARLVEALPPHRAKVICLDTDWNSDAYSTAMPAVGQGQTAIAQQSRENPTSEVTANNIAYVIYTSGSTGRPKGVMNTHKGLCNRLLWMQDAYQLTADDRVLQKTPFSFDVSVWEFFWTLLNGARLIVAKPGGHQDSAYLVKLITSQQITTLHFVPSMLQVFLEEPELESSKCLKRVICSGEVLPFGLQERFFARLDAELHNLYGPTEAAIDVTFWQCKRQSNSRTVPIGRPIANTQLYVLNSHLQPVPIGVVGELYIGGAGLARGYLNRPELTAEKFIPHPFSNEPGARLYKTGDLVRFRPDGNLEFIGRIDHQVKVRGFRIELGEIEGLLGQHPGVREAVVMAREDVPGDQRLVAYVVPATDAALTASQLRNFVKAQLPEYTIPSAFVLMDVLPLTTNGKVDRRALPAPDSDRPELEVVYQAPQTELEQAIATIWQDVLHLERVGIHDNFFDLGGYSLLMVQVHQRLLERLKQDIALVEMFEYPTISSLAKFLSQQPEESLFQHLDDRVKKQRAARQRQKQLINQGKKNYE